MKQLKVAILEDEPLARRRLSRLLQEADCVVAGEFEQGIELIEWLDQQPELDALFLDIQLPSLNGFEVLAEIKNPPAIVFVTASTDQAIHAFSVRATDYLVKPIYAERLQDTLDRIHQYKDTKGTSPAKPKPNLEAPSDKAETQTSAPHRITVKAGEGKLFLELRRISHFTIDQEVVWAWSAGKQFKTPWTCAREVEESLSGAELLKIQRNVLLRPEAVIGFRNLLGGRLSLRLSDGVEVEVSRNATPLMRERLKNF